MGRLLFTCVFVFVLAEVMLFLLAGLHLPSAGTAIAEIVAVLCGAVIGLILDRRAAPEPSATH